MDSVDPQTELFEGRWVTDNRTGVVYLIDLNTNRIILTRDITGEVKECNKLVSPETL